MLTASKRHFPLTYTQMYQQKKLRERSALTTPFLPKSPFVPLHDYYQKEVGNALASLDPKQFNKAVKTIAALQGKCGHVWTAGNGGSAAIADHAAHNLTWDCTRDFPTEKRISAISLSTQSNELTARANDTHSDLMFATMLDDQARPGDVFLAFTGSGESKNILNAMRMAKQKGIKTIVVARDGSSAIRMADVGIGIQSADQQVVEDVSQSVMHQLVRALHVNISGKSSDALLQDIAHLRDKSARVEAYNRQLGIG